MAPSTSQDDAAAGKVHFFDGTEDLEINEDLQFLLNKKLEAITNGYNEKL